MNELNQFRKAGCSDWYDGFPDHEDGKGPYEVRTLYLKPVIAPATNVAQIRDTELLDTLIRYCGSERFCLIDQKWHFLDPRGRIAGIGATQREAILAAIKKG